MTMGMGTWATKSAATVVVSTDGTGDTNDIQTGINLLPADGGVVYIREGTYTITQGIVIDRDNVALIGAGASTRIETLEPNIDIISANNRNALLIKNLYLYGNQLAAACSGITLGNTTNSIISECWLERFSANSIGVLGQGIFIRNSIVFDNTTSSGIYMNGTSCSISGCDVYDCAVNIEIENGDDCSVTNNSSHDANIFGLWVRTSDRVRIVNNHSYENIGHGIFLVVSDDCIISNNVCKDNDVTNTASFDGIVIDTCDNCIVSGNRCQDNDRYEINISDVASNDNLVLGNICLGADHVGTINDAGTNTRIAHNIEA